MSIVLPRGFVLLNKPAGQTSFQSLHQLKRNYGTKKIGHTGTLDKFATGVMIICVGPYTRLASYLTQQDKQYSASIRFGWQTDTLDPEGTLTATGDIPEYNTIKEVLPKFRGKILQEPPKYSAVHIDGKRAYKRTKAGEEFIIPTREVTIFSIDPIKYEDGVLDINVSCSKGTYIRSLARDLAKAFGTVGSLVRLERTQVGRINISNCKTHEEIENDTSRSIIDGSKIAQELFSMPLIKIKNEYLQHFLNGKSIQADWFDDDILLKKDNELMVINEDDTISGIINKLNTELTYKCVLP